MASALVQLGASPIVVDTRPEGAVPDDARAAAGQLGCPVFYGAPDRLVGADMVVLSPGVSVRDPFLQAAFDAGVEVIGEVELAARVCPSARIVGITGTNGKSTTTRLTGAILEAAGLNPVVCGNIGSPLISHVLARQDDPLFVTELSSFQLETVSQFHAVAATILNVSDDHRDRHPTLEEYVQTKARVFANQTSADTAVLKAEDPYLAALYLVLEPQRKLQFSAIREVEAGGFVRGGNLWFRDGAVAQAVVRRDEMRLRGTHNVENALAAICLSHAVGAPLEAMGAVLSHFVAGPHTYQPVGSVNGALYVNDSKGTNIDATVRALESCAGRVILIAGGSSKDADFAPLGGAIARHCRALLTIGETGPDIAASAKAANFSQVEHFGSLEDAVQRALELAEPGDTVLLSPACASFGLFRDYRHRGEVFEAAVRSLPGFVGTTCRG